MSPCACHQTILDRLSFVYPLHEPLINYPLHKAIECACVCTSCQLHVRSSFLALYFIIFATLLTGIVLATSQQLASFVPQSLRLGGNDLEWAIRISKAAFYNVSFERFKYTTISARCVMNYTHRNALLQWNSCH